MISTEAQTLDEALDILEYRAKYSKRQQRTPPTLRQELSANKLKQQAKPVSLSDRVVPPAIARRVKPPVRKPDVVWTKEQITAAYATGMFKYVDLARRGKVSVLQVKLWVHGQAYNPLYWVCSACKYKTQTGDADCQGCGKPWHQGLLP